MRHEFQIVDVEAVDPAQLVLRSRLTNVRDKPRRSTSHVSW